MIKISITKSVPREGTYPETIKLLEQDLEDESTFDLVRVIAAINTKNALPAIKATEDEPCPRFPKCSAVRHSGPCTDGFQLVCDSF